MAEDAQYSSGAKRKYDDTAAATPPSSGRRPTGFSAPILPSQSPDYPPPVDEIELAKQKAQEIAARLFNNSESKRSKFDNGGGYEAAENYEQKLYSAAPSAYSYGGSSKKIEIPNGRVGVIIGKGGETIKYLQLQSGAKIQITRDMEADPHSLTRSVEITGQADAIAKAEQLIKDVLAEAESGGSGIVSRRLPGQQGGEQFAMKVANNKVGLIIGKGGETIKSMQATTGARIQVIPLHLPPGDTSTERNVQINGTPDQIEAAKQLVNEVISENRLRNPMGSGGYSQQGYQAQSQTNWAQPGPQMQQQGYGYMQPGGYGQAGQYTQPPYGGYPQQTPGGYAAGWDQSKTGGAGGYDYYNQQQGSQTQPPGGGSSGPTDGSTYGYGQQGQTYGQDGYGGYGAGYGQQGYGNPTSGYNTSESTEGAAAPPTSQAGYGAPPPTSQAGYAAPPPTSQAGYAAAPPTSQAGYAAAPPTSQAGYGAAPPTSQAGYGAAPPTSQAGYGAPPPSGYAGYGPPPTQKPPVTPTYGQQPQQSPQGGYAQPASYAGGPPPAYGGGGYSQAPYGQQPAAYGGAYGGGYSQQPPAAAYSGDAAVAPPAQATPPNGGAVAKASPQS